MDLGNWSCSVKAAAIVMDIPVEDLISKIGHDGSRLTFPELREPLCRAGFDIQEIIEAAWELGWAVTQIDRHPQCTPDGVHVRDVIRRYPMEHYVSRYRGIGYYDLGLNWHVEAIVSSNSIMPEIFYIFELRLQ